MSTKKETKNVRSPKRGRAPLVVKATVLILMLALLSGCASSAGSLLTQSLSEPVGGATTAKMVIDPGDGNMEVDPLVASELEMASGTLEYLEKQGQPTHAVDTSSSPATLMLKASPAPKPWIRMPWDACNGATVWRIHLNPKVFSDLTAHTDGGNIKISLAGTAISRLLAETGGGNIDVALPEKVKNLSATVKTGGGNVVVELGGGIAGSSTVSASSGAGNVLVRLPGSMAARIHATSGMGKTVIGSGFTKIDDTTYQSPGYDSAADRVEITISSGAGNVIIETN